MLCTICNVDKPNGEFSFRDSKSGIKRKDCKVCCSKRSVAWRNKKRATDPEWWKERNRIAKGWVK